MGNIEVLYDEKVLEKRIHELGKELYDVYGDEEVVFVSILKGAIFFTVDLAKSFKGDARIEFLRVSSYEGETTTGKINLKIALDESSVKDKNVLIVEDIIDTGKTMKYLVEYLYNLGAKSVKSCVLLDKKSRRQEDIDADYVGFSIPDLFVVGYGLDYNQKYRNLPYIGIVK